MNVIKALLLLILLSITISCQTNKKENEELINSFKNNRNYFVELSNLVKKKNVYIPRFVKIPNALANKNKPYDYSFNHKSDERSRTFSFEANDIDIKDENSLSQYLNSDFVALEKGEVNFSDFMKLSDFSIKELLKFCQFAIQFEFISLIQQKSYLEFYLPGGRIINSETENLEMDENKEYYNIIEIEPKWFAVWRKPKVK